MMPWLASAALPLLRRLDAERAHGVALRALRLGLAGASTPDPVLATRALGMRLASPLGLAAGFDKDAVAVVGLLRLGFGFVEIGTVTRLPQAGNPRPRLFRLAEDAAVINRMGFNGQGADRVEARLRALPAGCGPIGVNLGINKQGANPLADYAALVRRFADLADYLVINVSSPNTPGLRDLQTEENLAALLATLPAARPKLLVKLAPDLAVAALPSLVETCVAAGVDGLIIANTTLDRPAGLRSADAGEAGGLSGAPLFERSTAMLGRIACLAGGRLTLIGVGGVASGAQMLAKLRAGASLVQLYTGFAYGGPGLVVTINRALAAALRAEGHESPAAVVGLDAASWSDRCA
jgi:dihydroorotate dehydrogenase